LLLSAACVILPHVCGFIDIYLRLLSGGSRVTKKYGLRTEIILHITLLLGAALLFGGFLLLKLTEREILDQRIVCLNGTVEMVASALGEVLGTERGNEALQLYADRFLRSLSSDTTCGVWKWADNSFVPVRLSGPEKAVLASNQKLMSVHHILEPQSSLSYPNAWFTPTTARSSYYEVTMPLYSGNGVVGALQMHFPLDGVGRRMRASFNLLIVYVFLYGAVLFVFGLYQLNRNVMRPIGRLMVSTREVAKGNLDEMVSEDGPAEIASLGHSFNMMVAALRDSRQRTDQHIRCLQQTNQDLQQARAELLRSEKMASIGHLAAGMAHEIGNPLAAVVGYLALLKMEIPAGPTRDIVDHAGVELERIDQLVRDVLDYAKPGNDQEEIIDPSAIVRQAISMLERQGMFESATLVDHLPDQLPCVKMVPHRLMQVCVNLLVNAKDVIPAKGKIEVTGGATDNRVWLAVADEGQGIPEQTLPHIFDPFFTTKAPGKGRGLGLAVCHRVVDDAGGTIEVKSEVGAGTRFKVILKRETGGDAG
jgi:signal transduction histidine kinase